ncbi:MAG: hypothetical protein E7353_00430 [Clostridiales bacterium]|nr:hypothetical protein [Clostridiales bacterium]
MSRKGNCLENSVMENLFGRLKVEMYYGEKYESVNAFIEKLHEYVNYYNNEIPLKLKMSPVNTELNSNIFNLIFCLNFWVHITSIVFFIF